MIVFLAKILDFIAAPRFDAVADSLKLGFISLSGFTDAARRVMFAFGIVPFSKVGDDLSFQFLDLQLAALESRCNNVTDAHGQELSLGLGTARALIGPFVSLERRTLTTIVRVETDDLLVDLAGLRRAAALYEDAKSAHASALHIYRKVAKRFGA